MENVLIPTDFTIRSLLPVIQLAEAAVQKKYSIQLFHVFEMPGSITELLLLQKTIPLGTLFSEELRAECRRIKRHYSNEIYNITFRPVYGTGSSVFGQMLEADNIDLVLYDDTYQYARPHRCSSGFENHLKRISVPVLTTSAILKKIQSRQQEQVKEFIL